MLDTGSPPENEEKNLAVSPPLSSHNVASRCSTPGLSSLDGTPRYLYVSREAPPLSSSPPSLDMAIRPTVPLSHGPLAGQDEMDRTRLSSGTAVTPDTPVDCKRALCVPAAPPITVPDAERNPVASLSHISNLLRSQRHHRHRCSQAEENLQCLQIATAKTGRLVQASRSIQRTLAECIRGEDKSSFANLLHAFHDACDDCSRPPSSTRCGWSTGQSVAPGAPLPFLQNLSSSSRASILEFLTKLRSNKDFVADRLASLTHKELLALLPERSNARSTDSILGGHSRIHSRTGKPLGFVVDTQIEMLSSYAYRSPLEALVQATRSTSGADRFEGKRMTDLWASVCARMISERKDGSDKLVPAILDLWISTQTWPGKDRLGLWILQTLQNGSFLLEQPSKQTFRARVEGRSDLSAEDEMRAEAFYNESADSFLDLIGNDHGPSVLPPGALQMCHAMWNSLSFSVGHQRALPRFLFTRWLFLTFVPDAIILPEAHGLLTDYYVSDLSRERILRQVANRVQKAAFEVAYSWTHGNSLSSETTQRVYKVMTRLQGGLIPTLDHAHHLNQPYNDASMAFLVVSARDVSQCLSALYPQRRPASIASDGDNLKSGLQSSASSVSGLSLFSNAKLMEPSSDSVVLDKHDCHSTDPIVALSGQETEDQSCVSCREAFLELEELISGHSTDTRDMWEVLCGSSADYSLVTMRERSAQITNATVGATPTSNQSVYGCVGSKELVSCTAAVEMLLIDDNTELSEDSSLGNSDGEGELGRARNHIEGLFEQSIQECEARADFLEAHSWFRRLRDFRAHISGAEADNILRDILSGFETTAVRSIKRTASLTGLYEEWQSRFKSTLQLRATHLEPLLEEHRLLRDKMWYVADVRVSGPYDEARSIAAALRIMGKSKRLSRTRAAPPLRHWNIPKASSTSMHLKTEAQILDILSANPDHGGPNKLSDEQAKLVEQWMIRQNVDNLCRGEERLHKLCMEVRKCVDLVTTTTSADHSSIQNNILFARDENFTHERASYRRPAFPTALHGVNGAYSYLSLTSQARSNEALSTTSRALSSVSSQDYLESRSPTLTNHSSVPFWSPSTTEVDSHSSATSIGTSRTQSAMNLAPHKPTKTLAVTKSDSIDAFRQRATSLLLSDLTSILFSDGSETDHAYWSGLGRDLTERYFRSLRAFHSSVGSQTPRTDFSVPLPKSIPSFDFESAFGTLLTKFSVVANPATKLACLYDIDRLLVPYVAEKADTDVSIAACRENSDSGDLTPSRRAKDPTETSISGFRDIFSKTSLRPATIFRDLQYIAALLPAAVLQDTPAGKAFCNAAVAISGLKAEARHIMVETADSIIAYHSNNRGHGRSSSTAQQQRDSAIFSAPSRTPSAEDVSRYSMADAGYLLQITAREGDTVAQRELATLYLTHPELMDRIVAPFARPKDVFKDELESKWRRNQDPNRCDPTTMCVAHHWMSLSSKGGDSLAREYLRQREEMDSF